MVILRKTALIPNNYIKCVMTAMKIPISLITHHLQLLTELGAVTPSGLSVQLSVRVELSTGLGNVTTLLQLTVELTVWALTEMLGNVTPTHVQVSLGKASA